MLNYKKKSEVAVGRLLSGSVTEASYCPNLLSALRPPHRSQMITDTFLSTDIPFMFIQLDYINNLL